MPHMVDALCQVVVTADEDTRRHNISTSDRTVTEIVHREIAMATNTNVKIEIPMTGAATGQQIIQIESDQAIYVSHETSAASFASGDGWRVGTAGHFQIVTDSVSDIWIINESVTNTAAVEITVAAVET